MLLTSYKITDEGEAYLDDIKKNMLKDSSGATCIGLDELGEILYTMIYKDYIVAGGRNSYNTKSVLRDLKNNAYSEDGAVSYFEGCYIKRFTKVHNLGKHSWDNNFVHLSEDTIYNAPYLIPRYKDHSAWWEEHVFDESLFLFMMVARHLEPDIVYCITQSSTAEPKVDLFNGIVVANIHHLLFIFRNMQVVLRGQFGLDSNLSQNEVSQLSSGGSITIQGALMLIPRVDEQYYIPPNVRIETENIYYNGNYFHAMREFNNRSGRKERIARAKRNKETFKDVVDRGYTTLRDSYGLPLNIGDVVAFADFGEKVLKLGRITSGTSKSIVVEEISTSDSALIRDPSRIVKVS